MCAMLDGFDEGIFDRRDETSVDDPNWARFAAISYSAQRGLLVSLTRHYRDSPRRV